MNFWTSLFDLVYPRKCAACGENISTDFLCAACRDALPIRTQDGCCHCCGKRFIGDEGLDHAERGSDLVCSECRHRPPAYALARSAVAFHGPMRTLIHQLKYYSVDWLAEPLADYLVGAMRAFYSDEKIDSIVPIPLHPVREMSRGYNQSERLAAALSYQLDLPMDTTLLERTRNTATQTSKTARERRQTLENAFLVPDEARSKAYGKCVLLIDDVMTTGATFHEASRALRAAGVARVLCLSLARD